MNSRERTLSAIRRLDFDRIPVDFWGSSGFYARLLRERGMSKDDFLNHHDVDIRYIEGPEYIGPGLEKTPDGISRDLWGVARRSITAGDGENTETYLEVVRHPLENALTKEDVDGYGGWPSPEWFDYSPVKSQCEALRAEGRAVAFMGDRLNRVSQLKPAMYLRGIKRIFIDMALEPGIAVAIFRRIRDFYDGYLKRTLEAAAGGIDLVVTGDDFGSQGGLLLSPGMWRDFIEAGFAGYIAAVKQAGAFCMHHTCGNVTDLVGDFVRCKLDILQSLQPECMGEKLGELKECFGGSLAFQGGISVQSTLPSGTPEDVDREVRQRVDDLAGGGGYIFGTAHNIQADCPLENVDALFRAYRKYG